MFFAYVHSRPNMENAAGIFYVGKGGARRAHSVTRRNPHHANVIAKYGPENILVGKIECSSEAIAFDLERGLIKCLRRMGVRLTNKTDGGEGLTNPSQETRDKIAASLTGTKASPETKKKLSAFQKHRMTSKAERDKSRSFLGRKHSQGSIAKMAAAKKGIVFTAEHRARLSTAKKGIKLHPEHAKKVGKANLGRAMDQATKDKISATWRDEAHRVIASDRAKGKAWVNDGAVNKRVHLDAIPEGFALGRLPLKPRKSKILK